jgi:hypothetical protein
MAENPDRAQIQKVIEGLASNAAAPEKSEVGPGSVAPSVSDTGNPLVPVAMAEGECQKWWTRIKKARDRRDARTAKWDILLKAYQPVVVASDIPEAVKYNGHFRNVHTKLGQLFYQSPDLILTAKDPSPASQTMPNPMNGLVPGAPELPPLKMEDIISIKQAVLDDKMGPDGIKGERLVDELLFDIMAWSGIAACKVGYLCTQKTVQTPVMGPDPSYIPPPPAPGSMLGLGAQPEAPLVPQTGPDGQPLTQSVTSTVYQDWFARRFSPKKLLFNHDLRSTRYDEEATWRGMEFFMAKDKAKRIFQLTDEELGKAASDTLHATYEDDAAGEGSEDLIHGVEIFCKSSEFTDEVHPLAFHQLIVIEGKEDQPVVWRPCPDQSFDEKGRLTQDSIDKNPIRIWAIRDLADSPYPEADAAFTNANIKAIGTWRRQSVQIRDAAIGKILYDLDAFDDQDVDKLKNAEIGAYIGVKAGTLNAGADKVLAQTAKVTNTPDDYRNANQLKTDMDEIIGIPPSATGMVTDTVHSATENSNATAGFTGRNRKEQSRVVSDYLDMVRMIDQLLMRYATEDDYTLIAGENGAKTIKVWNSKIISGRYLYNIAPDSQLSADNAQDFIQDLRFYNLASKDPLFNREYWLRRLARQRGADPNRVVLPPPPPQPPKPDLPSVSFSFKVEDILLGLVPGASPEMVQLSHFLLLMLEKATQTPGPVGPPGQPPHGGAGEVANEHEASNSGGRENAPGADNFREQPK